MDLAVDFNQLRNFVFQKFDMYRKESVNFNLFIEKKALSPEPFYFGISDFKENKLIVKSGMNKVVFIFEEMPNWVVKTPKFIGNDECKREVEVFSAALHNDLDDFFAPVFYLGSYCGQPYYIMERIDQIFEDFSNETIISDIYQKAGMSKKEADEKASCWENEDEFEVISEAMAVCFGIDRYEEFNDFCDIEEINDLHAANIGYAADGRIICIDYSGYHSGVYSSSYELSHFCSDLGEVE